jgi:uncharacterized protein (TIGR02001 family)
MKKRIVGMAGAGVLVGSLLAVGPAAAQSLEISGNVALASDYAFRGISQTLEKPAVQGGLDILAPRGFYAGLWGSSVNFGEDLSAGARAQMELDAYAGVAGNVASLDLDLGVLYYGYPGAASSRSYDFVEVYGGVSRQFGALSLGLNGAFAPEFFGGSGSGLFGAVNGAVELPAAVTLDGTVGHQTIEANDVFGTPDYTFWSVGLSTDVLGVSVTGSVLGTNLSESDCFGGSDLCGTRAIVSVSRAL